MGHWNEDKMFGTVLLIIAVILLMMLYAIVRPVFFDSRVVVQTGRVAGGNQQWIQQNDPIIKNFERDIRDLKDDIRELSRSEKVPN